MAIEMAVTPDGFVVGASGCIMGLVGATAALMARGWLREKARMARRRLLATLTIVALQSFLDAVIPQVSMVAHLSGVLIGAAMAMLFRHRLAPRDLPRIPP
jgi:rhomboid protease GluP